MLLVQQWWTVLCIKSLNPTIFIFLISNFCHVLKVVSFLLGNSPASGFYMPMFRNTVCCIFISGYLPTGYIGYVSICLFHLHTYPPMKMEQTECSKTSAYKIQKLRNYPEESIRQYLHCMKPKIGIHYPGVSQADDDVSLSLSLSELLGFDSWPCWAGCSEVHMKCDRKRNTEVI